MRLQLVGIGFIGIGKSGPRADSAHGDYAIGELREERGCVCVCCEDYFGGKERTAWYGDGLIPRRGAGGRYMCHGGVILQV